MSSPFEEAVERAQARYSLIDWWNLSSGERTRLIYAELKRIDREKSEEKLKLPVRSRVSRA
jgi:hypothetical protein